MRLQVISLTVCFLAGVRVRCQSIDDLIAESFADDPVAPGAPSAPINLTPTKTGGSENTGGDGCICVPYFLCLNDTIIIKDGMGSIDSRRRRRESRMKGNPCENYFEMCCEDGDVLQTPETTPAPVVQKPDTTPEPVVGCGFRNPEGVGFRIKGGIDGEAKFGEFPWMAAILREEPVEESTSKSNVYQCGGSLIHPQVVLTAAHCVTGHSNSTKYKIRAGEWDIQTKNEILPHQDRDVETIVTHDHYSSGNHFNDIALLFLKESVELAENVQVVCLPAAKSVINERECFASGWGKDVFGKEGKYQMILKKVELPIVENKKCQEQLRKTRLGTHFELHSSFICAIGVMGGDTCKGDGGSPLVCPIPGQKGRYQQVGIVSWGIGCGDSDIPGVYANVARFREWINEQMQYKRL